MREFLMDVIHNIKMISIADIIDIACVSVLFYFLYKFMRERRSGRLAVGIVCLIALKFVSELFDMYVIAKSGLRLRVDPSLNAEQIVLMPYGSSVYVFNADNPEWYFVQYNANGNTYEGWCSREYLDFTDPTFYTVNTSRSEYYTIDHSSGEFLYVYPSENSRQAAHVAPVSKIYYLYETDDAEWVFVKCSDNFCAFDQNERELADQPSYVTGWIQSSYLW